jgi:hypothetical protein
MWSLTAIIGVAVGGVAALLIVSVVLAVKIDRRRHRIQMHKHELSSSVLRRVQLPATENNYAYIQPPLPHVQRHDRPAKIPAIWNSVLSEESIPEFAPEQVPNTNPMPPAAKRWKGVRSSLNLHSFRATRTRQPKARGSNSNVSTEQSLTAFTESSDSAISPNIPPTLVELPAEPLPRQASKPSSPPPPALHIPKLRTRSASQELPMTERPPLARLVSATSTTVAPAEPLPLLPAFNCSLLVRQNALRASNTSIDTTDSLVLGAVLTSPARDVVMPSSEIHSFDFGFEAPLYPARLGVPPEKQTMQGFHSGKAVTSITPMFEYHESEAESLQATIRTITPIDDGSDLATNRTRHSVQDYGSILGKRNFSTEMSSPQLTGRPTSVGSCSPYQRDRKPDFSFDRVTAGSNDSRKGHRCQNCVRISSIPIAEKRNSRVEQIPEVEEEPTNEIKIPALTLFESNRPVLRARASLVDVQTSPSPPQRPILNPIRPRRGNTLLALQQDSDAFITASQTPQSARTSLRDWPLSTTAINKLAPPSLQQQHKSPILPSPIPLQTAFPRKSMAKGQRQYSSTRSESPIPLPAQVRKVSADDLRKSITRLRSMDSEILFGNVDKNYTSLGTHASRDMSRSNTTNSFLLHPQPIVTGLGISGVKKWPERRYGSSFHLQPQPIKNASTSMNMRPNLSTNTTLPGSASRMSIAGTLIWEDMYVGGDSPEPEFPDIPPQHVLPTALVDITTRTRRTPSHTPSTRDSLTMISMRTPTIAISDAGGQWDHEDSENFTLSVDQFTPVAAGGYSPAKGPWTPRRSKVSGDRRRDELLHTPQGKRLGLNLGMDADGMLMRTPGENSLYDGDGFLKE